MNDTSTGEQYDQIRLQVDRKMRDSDLSKKE